MKSSSHGINHTTRCTKHVIVNFYFILRPECVSRRVPLLSAVISGKKICFKSSTESWLICAKKLFFKARGGPLDIGLATACKHMSWCLKNAIEWFLSHQNQMISTYFTSRLKMVCLQRKTMDKANSRVCCLQRRAKAERSFLHPFLDNNVINDGKRKFSS